MTSTTLQRESIPNVTNPLDMDGIEFIEYASAKPQALGQLLESLGFHPVARHRSREVLLYRQGSMNLVVSALAEDCAAGAGANKSPAIVAVALRVQDALKAHTRCLELGAWDVQSRAAAMELHIPAIRGPGNSRFYFVDRWKEFSIYDIDFLPIPGVDQQPPALAGMSYFGLVQYIGGGRSADWMAYYENLFGFTEIPDDLRFGILPKGKLMRSPCGTFLWQLVEPDPAMDDDSSAECMQRIGLGCADVPSAVAALKAHGVEFVESRLLHPEDRGALTRTKLGSVSFELVHRAL